MKPKAIDLYCGLGGWTRGLLAEGWDVVGFDIERHRYGSRQYPAQLVLQDVRTIHGSQFRDVSLIVSSSPCQEFSYRAMPWKRAKALGPPLLGMELFAQAARIQREAIEAAGRFIPMIQENVRGAQPFVGRARWHYGSFYLWGDVPALMPMTLKAVKVGGLDWSKFGEPGYKALAFNTTAEQRANADDSLKCGGSAGDDWFTHHNRAEFEDRATKNSGGSWFRVEHGRPAAANDPRDGVKQSGIGGERANGKGDAWVQDGAAAHGSKSSARKAASARIAEIPLPLARHIAATYLRGALYADSPR